MGDQEFCNEHSGCTVEISVIKKAVADHEIRLRYIEQSIWKASGATATVVLIGQWVMQHYFK